MSGPTLPRRRLAGVAFPVGVLVVALGFAATTRLMSSRNDGRFVFPLDDSYIHLTVAHNLALHGTWGIVPGHFESASSSPLWTALLATCVFITRGHGEVALPLLLSAASAVWACRSATQLVGSRRTVDATSAVGATMLVLLPLVLIGMEHALHAALVLAALVPFVRVVAGTTATGPTTRTATRRDRVVLAVLLALGAACRLETIFVVAGMVVVLTCTDPESTASTRAADGGFGGRLRRRRFDLATVIVPPVAMIGTIAVWNRAMGQGWLPNSILVKASTAGRFPILSTLGDPDPLLHLGGAVLIVIVTGVIVVTGYRHRPPSTAMILAIVTLSATVAQVTLTVWSDRSMSAYRYHGYLVVMTVLAAGCAIPTGRPHPSTRLRMIAVGLVAVLLAVTAVARLTRIPQDAWEVGHQQLQTAEFFGDHARGTAVALNDLGAVSYLHTGPIVDLAGLGSWDVARASRHGRIGPATIEEISRRADVEIAALYPDWFPAGLPVSWEPLEQWCLDVTETGVLGDRCVTFYAVAAGSASRWRAALAAFHPRLPTGVDVRPPEEATTSGS